MNENEKKWNKNKIVGNRLRGVTLIAVFLVIIFGFTAMSVMKKDISFSANENRVLQQRPEFSSERLFDGTFTKQYESYVTDQFVGRDHWIAGKVYVEKMLQKKDINGVYFGKDNYLIQQHDKNSVDETQVKKNLDRIQRFVDMYANKLNINVMIVPTSSEVLANKLPSYAQEYDQKKLMSEIESRVGSEHYVNVEEVLSSHADEYIYYRTDHHWTSLGAYYAYEAAGSKLGYTPYAKDAFDVETATNDFLGTTYSKVNIPVKADSIDLYRLKDAARFQTVIDHGKRTIDGLFDLEKLKEKDKYPVFLGGNNAYVEISGGVKNGKTLLVVKDSFAHTFVPFLANHYEKIIMVDYRYFNSSTSKLIAEEKVSDVLFLYNTMNFVEDKNIIKMLV